MSRREKKRQACGCTESAMCPVALRWLFYHRTIRDNREAWDGPPQDYSREVFRSRRRFCAHRSKALDKSVSSLPAYTRYLLPPGPSGLRCFISHFDYDLVTLVEDPTYGSVLEHAEEVLNQLAKLSYLDEGQLVVLDSPSNTTHQLLYSISADGSLNYYGHQKAGAIYATPFV